MAALHVAVLLHRSRQAYTSAVVVPEPGRLLPGRSTLGMNSPHAVPACERKDLVEIVPTLEKQDFNPASRSKDATAAAVNGVAIARRRPRGRSGQDNGAGVSM
jgi:hypothetical protein